MRLTNVSQMTLPLGRLSTLKFQVRVDHERPVPISFDQRRHVGLGDRPASWMAIAFRVPLGTSRSDLETAWRAVVDRHGTLRTVFELSDDGEMSLHEAEVVGAEWREHPVPAGTTTRQIIREVFDVECRSFARPSHVMALVEPELVASFGTDARPVVVVGADHSHLDMWSLAVIVRDFSASLAGDVLRVDVEAAECFAAHTALLEQKHDVPAQVMKRWHEILDDGGGYMPTFPMPLGDVSVTQPEVVEIRDVLDSVASASFEQRAASLGVRPTALAMSVLTRETFAVSGQHLRAVFPVHSRMDRRWAESVGWFITNSVLEITDTDPAACAAALKEALVLGSYPLAPIFASTGGMPEPPGMFAVSWLDMRRLPAMEKGVEIQYVSAAIKTDGVMIWFALNDDGLHLRCRYPDTDIARHNVGRWLDAVVAGLQSVSVDQVA